MPVNKEEKVLILIMKKADDRDILTKAKDFAQMRINQMKSPFMESYDIPMKSNMLMEDI